jgi:hypothetical protein
VDNKAFLDQEILGANVGTVEAKKFQRLNLVRPAYNSRFFEAFPTMWATSYAFQKRIESHDREAIEEWICLFLLQNFGVLKLKSFSGEELKKQYDKDLWPALSVSYPQKAGQPAVMLLRTFTGTVVGGFYPEIFFFPCRGRAAWRNDRVLNRYLEQGRLSWKQCTDYHLNDKATKDKFCSHLLQLPVHGTLAVILQNFCKEHLGGLVDFDSTRWSNDPTQWPLAGGRGDDSKNKTVLLSEYPLKRTNDRQGTTYFLLDDMPTSEDWMTTNIRPGLPAPSQYHRPPNSGPNINEIVVELDSERIPCELGLNDDVVMLHECFLEHPAMCSINDESHLQRVKRPFHQLVADGRGICKTIKSSDTAAILLAPINDLFLKHFPDIVVDPDKYELSMNRDLPGDTVTWRFKIEGKHVSWTASPQYMKELANAGVALWPPKVARGWGVYIAYGSGVKIDVCGRWELVSPAGPTHRTISLAADEYVSIMQSGDVADYPSAMLLRDTNGIANGVLFLDIEDEKVPQPRTARLAVDFGTSNTCLAYDSAEAPVTLKFSLSPQVLWGPNHDEAVGFVPFKWGGKDGYFPTVLLSRLVGWETDLNTIKENLSLEHIFRVDIPALHQKVEDYMLKGSYSDVWSLHDDLKWNSNDMTPWRSLFISLVLLYAHAELYFKHHAKVAAYAFTYPLAFGDTERDLYIHDTFTVTNRIRSFCYTADQGVDLGKFFPVDESSAIANFLEAKANRETLELFIDTGGGTTDIALRYNRDFLVLDSIKVAGKSFFQFARTNFERNMRGGSEFKKHLASLLTDRENEELHLDADRLKQLDTFYSLAINRLDDISFRKKERNILPPTEGRSNGERGMGANSFQRYRSRLFFQQTIAYALVQACAAAVNRKLEITNGIKLILGGNAWGLLAFAELERKDQVLRDEAEWILDLIKQKLVPTLPEELKKHLGEKLTIAGVTLLNGERLSEAKTAVARGALSSLDAVVSINSAAQSPHAFTGLSLEKLQVNGSEPVDLFWFDLWGKEGLSKKLNRRITDIRDLDFERSHDIQQANPVLTIFTSLGNTANPDVDLLPQQDWVNINSTFQEQETYLGRDGLNVPPLNYFVSEMLYPARREHQLLNALARENKSFENR